MCDVQWCPSIKDHGGMRPLDSLVPYEDMKQYAPTLVVDFYERHMVFVPKKKKDEVR